MTRARIDPVASAVILVGAFALFVDLFLGWHKVAVQAGGVVDIHATSSGWSGWGIAAGAFAIALVVVHGRSLARPATTVGSALVTAALAAATAGFTLAQALLGEASVTAGPTAVVASTRMWPAYAAIVLAVTIAVAALVRLVTALPAPGPAPHAA